MFKLLIDTCVWLDLAKDSKQAPIVGVLEEMIRLGLLKLIVPQIILDEFRRNRERIAKESAKSLSSHIRLVKEAVTKAGGSKKRVSSVLSHLDDVGHKVPLIGGEAVGILDRIEALLTAEQILQISDAVRLRAAQRAIDKRAPFHRDRNAMADAVIMEVYHECVNTPPLVKTRFGFVSHNKAEFSAGQDNQKLPHPDFAASFSKIKSLYFINLPEALRHVEPSLVGDIMMDHFWNMDPRGLTEIMAAEELLYYQVWYNRHWNTRIALREGRIKLVKKVVFPRKADAPNEMQRDVWKGALEAARRTEKRFGKKNLGLGVILSGV